MTLGAGRGPHSTSKSPSAAPVSPAGIRLVKSVLIAIDLAPSDQQREA